MNDSSPSDTPNAQSDIVDTKWDTPFDAKGFMADLEGMRRYALNECGLVEKRRVADYMRDVRRERGMT